MKSLLFSIAIVFLFMMNAYGQTLVLSVDRNLNLGHSRDQIVLDVVTIEDDHLILRTVSHKGPGIFKWWKEGKTVVHNEFEFGIFRLDSNERLLSVSRKGHRGVGSFEDMSISFLSTSQGKITKRTFSLDDNDVPKDLEIFELEFEPLEEGLAIVHYQKNYDKNHDVFYHNENGDFYRRELNSDMEVVGEDEYLGFVIGPESSHVPVIAVGIIGESFDKLDQMTVGHYAALERTIEASKAEYSFSDIEEIIEFDYRWGMGIDIIARVKDGNIVHTSWLLPRVEKYWRNSLKPLRVVENTSFHNEQVVKLPSAYSQWTVDPIGQIRNHTDNKKPIVKLPSTPKGCQNSFATLY